MLTLYITITIDITDTDYYAYADNLLTSLTNLNKSQQRTYWSSLFINVILCDPTERYRMGMLTWWQMVSDPDKYINKLNKNVSVHVSTFT